MKSEAVCGLGHVGHFDIFTEEVFAERCDGGACGMDIKVDQNSIFERDDTEIGANAPLPIEPESAAGLTGLEIAKFLSEHAVEEPAGIASAQFDGSSLGLIKECTGSSECCVFELDLVEAFDDLDSAARRAVTERFGQRIGDVGKNGALPCHFATLLWHVSGSYAAPEHTLWRLNVNIELLKRLCETPGVPGREERVRVLIEKEVAGLFDEVSTDPLGSLICRRKPRAGAGAGAKKKTGGKGGEPLKVMLLCHMDEIGFYINHIDDKGFLWLDPAGGFDARNLFSRRVKVCTASGDLPGVMNPGGRPIHISSEADRSKVPEIKEFCIDTGLKADKVKKTVKVGDYVVMDEPFREMGDKLVSKAMDNRVACWLGIESVRQAAAAKAGHACEVIVAFTTQEEVGLRGARAAAYAVKPDIGFGIDVTLAVDTPGVPDQEAVTRHGQGFGLHLKDSSFIADAGLAGHVEKVAIARKIPYQRTILARGGQDGAAAQQAAAGAKAIGITVGTRYIHTVTEMIDKRDLKAACDILAAMIGELK